MHHLRILSIIMVIAGGALAIASIALGLGAMWTIGGMLLAVAGVVKVVMVALWTGIAGMGSPRVPEEPG